MIAGVGIDTVALSGFRAQLADAASAFVDGTFTAAELADARLRPDADPARHLAARFAAKEAFLKAWSATAWGQEPQLARADLREIEVVSDAWGRPRLRLRGQIARLCQRFQAHVSLSHDGDLATAIVVLATRDAIP